MKLRYQMRGLGIGVIVTAILMGAATSHGIPLTDAEIKARALELGMIESNSLKLSDVAGASGTAEEGNNQASGQDANGTGINESEGSSAGAGAEDLDGMPLEGSEAENPDGTPPEGSEAEEPDGTQPEGSEEKDSDGSASGSGGAGDPAGTPPEGSEAEDSDGMPSGSAAAGDQETAQPGDTAAEGGAEELVRYVKDGDIVTIIIDPGADSYAISRILAQAGLVESAGGYDEYLCNNLYSRKIVNGSYDIPIGTSEEEIAKIITLGR